MRRLDHGHYLLRDAVRQHSRQRATGWAENCRHSEERHLVSQSARRHQRDQGFPEKELISWWALKDVLARGKCFYGSGVSRRDTKRFYGSGVSRRDIKCFYGSGVSRRDTKCFYGSGVSRRDTKCFICLVWLDMDLLDMDLLDMDWIIN